MSAQPAKRKRGRPSKGDAAMDAIQRQRRYVRARRNEAGEIARALKLALATDTARKAFKAAYAADMPDGQLIRRGLAQVLTDDPTTLAFFNRIFVNNGK